MSQHTFIIAEFGSCHDNAFANVLRGVQAAKQAGADAFKLQYWSDPKRLAERRHAEAYFPVYAKYQIPDEWLRLAAQECRSNGIEFMCTCYLPEDIETVAPHVERFKVASFEAGDLAFLRAHEPFHKPVVVSTGMMDGRPGHTHGDMEVWWLHCVSSYPTPSEQANLSVLWRGQFDGFSDHTRNILTGAFAVCAGARILEVHFRLDETDPANPDFGTALTPVELGEYVSLVRTAEKMLGGGVKSPQACEAEMSRYRVRA